MTDVCQHSKVPPCSQLFRLFFVLSFSPTRTVRSSRKQNETLVGYCLWSSAQIEPCSGSQSAGEHSSLHSMQKGINASKKADNQQANCVPQVLQAHSCTPTDPACICTSLALLDAITDCTIQSNCSFIGDQRIGIHILLAAPPC